MSANVEYSVQPSKITFMLLPDGQADVWLRENIAQTDSVDDKDIVWTADEVYFRTTLSEEEVTENFDTLYKNNGQLSEEVMITTEDRLEALEAAVIELAEVITNG